MRLHLPLFILAIIQNVFAVKPPVSITPEMKGELIDYMNQYRSNVGPTATNMYQVTYNHEMDNRVLARLQQQADNSSWVQTYQWLYSVHATCKQPKEFDRPLQFYCLFDEPEFADLKAQGCRPITHDTCTAGKYINVVSFRLEKGYCCNFKGCDTEMYTGYRTCNRTEDTKAVGAYCANSWMYQCGPFVQATIANMSILALSIAGPFTTHLQKFSYILFTCNGNAKDPTNDVPYIPGPSASQCPPDREKQGKLCALRP
jgi:hypothetical protein